MNAEEAGRGVVNGELEAVPMGSQFKGNGGGGPIGARSLKSCMQGQPLLWAHRGSTGSLPKVQHTQGLPS